MYNDQCIRRNTIKAKKGIANMSPSRVYIIKFRHDFADCMNKQRITHSVRSASQDIVLYYSIREDLSQQTVRPTYGDLTPLGPVELFLIRFRSRGLGVQRSFHSGCELTSSVRDTAGINLSITRLLMRPVCHVSQAVAFPCLEMKEMGRICWQRTRTR